METITKILTLIPDNWDDVLAQAERLESHVGTAHTFVGGQQATIKSLVARAVEFVVLDWTKIDDWLSGTQFYQHLEEVSLDIPALLSVPDDMDWRDQDQLNTWITAKFELLKVAFANVSIERRSGGTVDTSLALEQLKTVVNAMREISEGIDFEDAASVELFRSRMTETVKPAMFTLLNTLFGIDLSESSTSAGADSVFSLPQKIKDAQPEPPEAFDEVDNEDVRTTLQALSAAKHTLPVLQQELESVAGGGSPLSSILSGSEDFVVHLQQHLPGIAAAFSQVVDGQDWTNIDAEQLKTDVQQLSTLVVAWIDTSPLVETFRAMAGSGASNAMPIKLVGFDESWTTEQKLTQLVQDLIAIFTLPDDFSDLAPDALIPWLRSKIDALVALINHIELAGFTAAHLYQRVKTPLDELFSTEGADLSSPDGITEFFFDKVVLLANMLNPASGSSQSETDGDSASNSEPDSDTSESSWLASRLSQTGGNLIQLMLTLVAELVEKAKLIWLFIQNNDLGFSLKDQDADFKPAALTATNYQVNAGAAADPQSESNTGSEQTGDSASETAESASGADGSNTNSSESGGSANSGSGDSADSSTSPQNSGSEDVITAPPLREVVSLEMIIRNLLGDRDSGVISYLPTEVQDVMLGILNGEYQQKFVDDITAMWDASGVEQQLEAHYQALVALQTPQTDENGDPVRHTAASLVSQLVAGVGLIYNAVIAFAEQAVTLLIDIVFEVINTLFDVIKAFKVPTSVRNILPHQLEDALLGEHDPNLLCLIAAIPTVILTGFLTVPVETINSWIAEAA